MRKSTLYSTFILLLFILLSMSNTILAQSGHGKVGIGVPISTLSTSPTLNFKFWTEEILAIESSFGFRNISRDGNNATSYIFSTVFEHHWGEEKFKKYIGIGGLVNYLSTGDGYTDGAVQAVVGLEYFVLEPLSFGAEMQLNCYFADKTFSPSGLPTGATIIQTNTIALARFYF